MSGFPRFSKAEQSCKPNSCANPPKQAADGVRQIPASPLGFTPTTENRVSFSPYITQFIPIGCSEPDANTFSAPKISTNFQYFKQKNKKTNSDLPKLLRVFTNIKITF